MLYREAIGGIPVVGSVRGVCQLLSNWVSYGSMAAEQPALYLPVRAVPKFPPLFWKMLYRLRHPAGEVVRSEFACCVVLPKHGTSVKLLVPKDGTMLSVS